jgi:predicted Zn-dependent peptidase
MHCGLKIGPVYEEVDEKGISHFIEHMLFKGTKTKNNEELNECLEGLGGEYNAYTDFTSTVYSVTALEEELENAAELLSDMILNSTFPEEEIEKERGVILSEIRTSKDDIEDYSFQKISEYAFKKSDLRYEIIGEEKSVKSFKRKHLIDFYNRYYLPNNACITVVSSKSHEQVQELIKKYFSKWQGTEMQFKQVICEKNIPGKHTTYKKAIEQSTIIYLYTFYNLSKREELCLKILNHKLGESANSILFRELREERGLAYDVYTQLDLSNYIKTLYIYTAVGEDQVEEAMTVIDDCIERVKTEKVLFDDKTVSLMKKVLKTAIASTLEDSSDLGNYVLHQTMDGENIYEFGEDMENMNEIKGEHIYNIGRVVLSDPTIHVLKPKN